MKRYVKALLTIIIAGLLCLGVIFFLNYSKHQDQRENAELTISVSIPPLKFLVDKITGGTYPVNVILPPGSGPETYEPTPKQLKELESSPLIVITGLIDFENNIAHRVASTNTLTINLSKGIELIEDEHHSHSHQGHEHSHCQGVDPHIWTSPRCLKIMAANIIDNLPQQYRQEIFNENYRNLLQELDQLDADIKSVLKESGVTSFLIYHPALTYYAQDYGLEQVQLEYDGKEPSADKLAKTISRAKAGGLDKVLYQKEFNLKAVETAAKDIGAMPVEIDPLDEDIISNLYRITEIIAN